MIPSSNAKLLCITFESMAKKRPDGRYEAYPDPATGDDPWTIGVGATGTGIAKGTVWTREQCLTRFAQDMAKCGGQLDRLLDGAATTQNQFDAMTVLLFNIGIGNFGTSTLLKMHKAENFDGAQFQFVRWNRAAGQIMAGLTRRRIAEAALYGSVGAPDMAKILGGRK